MPPSIKLIHNGQYGDGRLNTSSILIKDVDFGFEFQTRKETCYVPSGGSITIPYTNKSAYSLVQGDIFKFSSIGMLTYQLLGFGGFDFTDIVANIAGIFPLSPGEIQRYDASTTAPNSIFLEFPSSPLFNDQVGIKKVGNSIISIVLDGNGKNLEGIGVPPAATQNLTTSYISLSFKFDGITWRII